MLDYLGFQRELNVIHDLDEFRLSLDHSGIHAQIFAILVAHGGESTPYAASIYDILKLIKNRRKDAMTPDIEKLLGAYENICKIALLDPTVKLAYEGIDEAEARIHCVTTASVTAHLVGGAHHFANTAQMWGWPDAGDDPSAPGTFENYLTAYHQNTPIDSVAALDIFIAHCNAKLDTYLAVDNINRAADVATQKAYLQQFRNAIVNDSLYQHAVESNNTGLLNQQESKLKLPEIISKIRGEAHIPADLITKLNVLVVVDDNTLRIPDAANNPTDITGFPAGMDASAVGIAYLHRWLWRERITLEQTQPRNEAAITAIKNCLIKISGNPDAAPPVKGCMSESVLKALQQTRDLLSLREIGADLDTAATEILKKQKPLNPHTVLSFKGYKAIVLPAEVSLTGLTTDEKSTCTDLVQLSYKAIHKSKQWFSLSSSSAGKIGRHSLNLIREHAHTGIRETYNNYTYELAIQEMTESFNERVEGYKWHWVANNSEEAVATQNKIDRIMRREANSYPTSEQKHDAICKRLIKDYHKAAAKPGALGSAYLKILDNVLEQQASSMSENLLAQYFAIKAKVDLMKYKAGELSFDRPNEGKQAWAQFIIAGLEKTVDKMTAGTLTGSAALQEMVQFLLKEECVLTRYRIRFPLIKVANGLHDLVEGLIKKTQQTHLLPKDFNNFIELSFEQSKKSRGAKVSEGELKERLAGGRDLADENVQREVNAIYRNIRKN